jgi:hypothetical protein
MTVINMTLKTGGTSSVTGGTDMVFAPDGQTIQNGIHLVVPATADYRVREQATLKYRAPALDSNGEYTKDKKTMSITIPMVTAAGKVVFNVFRLEREVHPEFSAANALNLNQLAAQALYDTDLTSFWAAGSLS